jgi:MFS family permease
MSAVQRVRAHAPFLGVFASVLSCFVAIGAVLPVLPLYVDGPLGGNDITVGVVGGAFAFTAVIGRPLAGRFADRNGRKRLVIAGCVASALASALYLVPLGIPWLIFARLVAGVGEACTFGIGAAWVVDLVPEARRGQGMALFGLSVWGGLAIGPAIGEVLLDAAGYDAVWIFAAIIPLVGMLAIARVRDTYVPDPDAPPAPLFSRAAIRPGAALSLSIVGLVALMSFLVLHLDQEGIAGGGFVFTTYAAALVLARLLGGQVIDRAGPVPTLLGSTVLQALGLVLIAFAGNEPLVFAGAVVSGLGVAYVFPALAVIVSRRADPKQMGSAMGTFTAFFDIGVALGSPVAGVVAAAGGYPAAFIVGAVGALFAGMVVVRVPRAVGEAQLAPGDRLDRPAPRAPHR